MAGRSTARQRLAAGAAARAEAARRRRRRTAIIAAGAAAVLLAVVGVVWAVAGRGDDGGTGSGAAPSAGALDCGWNVVPENARAKEMKHLGTPGGDPPRTGTQTLTLNTNRGTIRISIDRGRTPCAAASFAYLTQQRFYDNSGCHRLVNVKLFALHCGDPTGTGMGGPTYRFVDENVPSDRRPAYPRGSVALANGGVNTNQSQFYLVYADSDLPASAPVVGRITEGLNIVEDLAKAGHDSAFERNPDGSAGPGGGRPKIPLTILSTAVS